LVARTSDMGSKTSQREQIKKGWKELKKTDARHSRGGMSALRGERVGNKSERISVGREKD